MIRSVKGLRLKNIAVYPDQQEADAAHPHPEEGDEISYLKEQAWKVDFGIAQVKRHPIHEVIRTSGEFQPMKGEERVISAKSSGIVSFRDKNLQEGKEVRNGQSLFSISSRGLITANIEERYEKAQARVTQTNADFERAERLLQQQIIGQREYEKRKADLAVAEAELKTLSSGYKSGGQSLSATMTGIIKETDGKRWSVC